MSMGIENAAFLRTLLYRDCPPPHKPQLGRSPTIKFFAQFSSINVF